MNKTKIIFAMAVLFAITFTACETDKDTQKPVIELIEPANKDVLLIGDEHGVHLDMKLSDNEALASYKIDIHANFDGHVHAAMQRAPKLSNTDSIAFSFQKSWYDIEGKRNADIHHHDIVIPETFNGKPIKEGHYHFIVYCVDKAGNETHVAHEIELSYTPKSHDHEH